MTRKQLTNFIRKYTDIKINILNEINENCFAYIETAYFKPDKKRILVSVNILKDLFKESDSKIKRILLHEMGHVKSEWGHSNALFEIRAQLWSIKEAKRLKYFKVVKIAENDFLNWYSKKYDAVFNKAYKLAVKKGIIKKGKLGYSVIDKL